MSIAPGTRLGPYEISEPLGAGAMGEVYRARDPRLQRSVAIKILPEAFARDPDRLRRFEQESRAAGSLNHPNIVTVFDVGALDGSPYVVQELLEGETLRQRLDRGALPARRVVDWASQIARGLAAAHEKGIVHRDLKPENLVVTNDGRIKILDFGLAKLMRGEASGPKISDSLAGTLTEAGVILGTAGYMAPEQVRGEAADARSDLFAFGAILYEMLSGQRAFRGESAIETLNAILHTDPPPLPSGVPPALDRNVRHCLEKNPAERFQSARDLAFALESSSEPAEVAASGSPAESRAVSLASPRNLLLGAVAAMTLLVAGALLGRWLWLTPESAPPRMRALSWSAHDIQPTASPDGRTVAFTSDRDGKRRIWLKDVAGGGEVALTGGSDAFPRFSPDGSTLLFTRADATGLSLYRIAVVGGEARKMVDDALDGDWSPDGKSIAFVRSDQRSNSLLVSAATGGPARTILRVTDGLLFGPRWSPDGHLIALTKAGTGNSPNVIQILRPDGHELRTLTPPPPRGDVSNPVWVGNTHHTIVYIQSEGVVSGQRGQASRAILHDLGSGKARVLAWLAGFPGVLDVLATEKLVCSVQTGRQNMMELPYAAAEKRSGRWLTRGGSIDRQPAYAPDGEWVIFSSNRAGNLDLWEVSTRTGALKRITDDAADDWDPAYTSDGRHVLWSSNRSGVFEIWMANRDGSGARQVSRDSVDAENPTMGRDGQWIVYASSSSRKAGLWKVRPDGTDAKLLVPGNVFIPDISPDGQYVAYGLNPLSSASATEIHVVRVADGSVVPFRIAVTPSTVGAVAAGRQRWTPDGRAIVFVDVNASGAFGLSVQDFAPGTNTDTSRRPLTAFDPDVATESFGISPDGTRLTVSYSDPLRNLVVIEGLKGVDRPSHARRAGD